MPAYKVENIRNIALVGHTGSGKTSLGDTILYEVGVTNRKGSVVDKTSVLDFDDEEKQRGCSLDSKVVHFEHNGKLVNLIDTPGAPDFIGPAVAALAAVETAVCVVSAADGIGVNTRRMMQIAADYGLARMIVVNHIDADNVNLSELLSQLQEVFGSAVVPVNLPTDGGKAVVECFRNADGSSDLGDVSEAHTKLVDAILDADEALMEEYLEAGDIEVEKLIPAAPKAVATGKLIPVVFTSAKTGVGIKEFLNAVTEFLPSPVEGLKRNLVKDDGEEQIEPDPAGSFVAQVFKIMIDPKSNIKYSFLRIHRGTAKADSSVQVGDERKSIKLGHLLKFQAADHKEVDEVGAGDIIAVAKLDLHIGEVLHAGTPGSIPMPKFPTPMYSVAIQPKARGDEVKISEALSRLADTDPCFKVQRDQQTNELIVSGIGDLHMRVMLSRMAKSSKVEVETKPPKIPYRETITVKAGHYRHKKQTGGAGQFGEVFLRVEPTERGSEPPLQWEWAIFGGAIPSQFEQAVRKGVEDLMAEGAVAGFPMQDIKVTIYDGKHHPVDSKEVAFRIAGKYAMRDAVLKAKPVILEPIVNLEVTCPVDKVGDITGDLASRRGRPQGQEILPGGMAVIRAQVPLAELSDYSGRLSSLTGGQGSYTMEFSHYEPVPPQIQQQLIAQYKPKKEEEE